jgi:hypothetical protein
MHIKVQDLVPFPQNLELTSIIYMLSFSTALTIAAAFVAADAVDTPAAADTPATTVTDVSGKKERRG